MIDHAEFVFSGFGGQGVMFVGQLLAYAGMEAGFNVTWIPSYGPEMRGGTAHCFVVLSKHLIGSPLVQQPSVAVVFNNPSFEKYEPLVRIGGVLVVNSSLVTARSKRKDIDQRALPATHLAEGIASPKLTNMALLGAALDGLPMLPLSAVHSALDAHMPAHHRDLLESNHQALDAGFKYFEGEPRR